MSDNTFTDVITEDTELGIAIFNMANLKYFFFMLLILSFLVMSFSKGTNNRNIRMSFRRRKIAQSWTNEKRDKIKALSKKTVDIKDFKSFKPSDVENITAINTLVNSYISKMYEEIKPLIPLSGQNNEDMVNTCISESSHEDSKSNLSSLNDPNSTLNKKSLCTESLAASSVVDVVAAPPGSINNFPEGLQISGEMEQGSERSTPEDTVKESLLKSHPGIQRKRSILKTQKNVWFDLGQNKVKII
eukprot:CAMPEP_0196997998 /NCGR_PEP_ID=MMETSP1380-20130617/3487_1 /TAXON_ID=5936 /ORGANISM="Euplotes crassus, Strain CT5" /LENGTH=244 /DNA_ID=CAMNT_0042414417 /DNA_START=3 /DNA_END=737 /DNA_ORIENTATION=+